MRRSRFLPGLDANQLVRRYRRAVNLAHRVARHVDIALAIALLAFAEEHVWWGGAGGSKLVTVPAAAVASLAVAWRSSRPLVAATVAAVAVSVQSLLASSPQAPWLIAAMVALVYSVGSIAEVLRALAGAAILAVGLAVDVVTAVDRSASGAVFVALLVVLPWLAGRAVHRREHRAQTLERSQEVRAREAVREERARIGRELHDMVAHAVSLVVVQAEAAEAVLDCDPDRSREQLQAIQHTGRQALAEMTRLLGMLRHDDIPGASALEPQPSLSRLELLLTEVRQTGLAVDLTVDGKPSQPPPGVDLAAYRIVQEALTNTRKHAAATRAHVQLRYRPEAIELFIRDDGRGANGNGGAGHGLIGMRERIHLYGGTLTTGTREDGGYEVRARLPLVPQSA